MNLMFSSRRALKTFILNAQNKCETPLEFEKWLSDNAGRLYVQGDKEPYTASELAELV